MREKLNLIDRVLKQIRKDMLESGDITAIEELLTFVPVENLRGFLPEAMQQDNLAQELVDLNSKLREVRAQLFALDQVYLARCVDLAVREIDMSAVALFG